MRRKQNSGRSTPGEARLHTGSQKHHSYLLFSPATAILGRK
jgi:hypothetical protein